MKNFSRARTIPHVTVPHVTVPHITIPFVAILSVTVLTGCVTVPPSAAGSVAQPDAPEAVIRVDQVGYGVGESKRALVLGNDADLDGSRFRVLDADKTVVQSGSIGAKTGSWNDSYDSVRIIDFTELATAGRYSIELDGPGASAVSPPFTVAPISALLQPLADSNVTFFQAQRDGADVISTVLGRKPSHLLDAQATVYETPNYVDGGQILADVHLMPAARGPVDVSGGWFDAGDYLKFTGTTAYATTEMLLALRGQGESNPTLAAEADFGLEWLQKMWDSQTQTLFLQVGIGSGNDAVRTDHDVWRLPEADDLSTAEPGDPDYTIAHRPVFAANEPSGLLPPAVAGRVSAAFALAAQRSVIAGNLDDARARLALAAEIYALADRAPTSARALATALPAEFYPEESWQDDLELATTELATAAFALQDPRAQSWQREAAGWAANYIDSDVVGTLGLADVSSLAHADLIALGDPSSPALLEDLRRQLDSGVQHAEADPFGAAASTLDFDSVPVTFGLVATAALYENVSGDSSYRPFASRQRGWALGANAWGSSFMIGAGSSYPRCPQHQIANLTDLDVPGRELSGAVVNGPNEASKLNELNGFDTMRACGADGVPYSVFDGQGSRYLDDVGAWQTVEPSLDFTSTALLAFTLTAALPPSR